MTPVKVTLRLRDPLGRVKSAEVFRAAFLTLDDAARNAAQADVVRRPAA